MSYPRTIEDMSTEELVWELKKRAHDRSQGLCDYCQRKASPSSSPCKFPLRHKPNSAPPTHIETRLEGGMIQHVFVVFVEEP